MPTSDASNKAAWMKFYPTDWRADPGLRLCGFAARGLWIDLISLMHESEVYGHFLLGKLEKTTEKNIAKLLGGTVNEVRKLLAELERNGVFSRTAEGAIFSRRMVRDDLQATVNRENGRRGGNPNLKPTVNPDPKGGLTRGDKAQSPESRLQSKEVPRARENELGLPAVERDASARIVHRKGPLASDPPAAWLHLADRLPDGTAKTEIDDDGITQPVCGGAYVQGAAELVCDAAGINPVTFRGDWRPLLGWLRDSFDLSQIVASVAAVASRPGYQPPTSLAYFDNPVRQRRRA